MDALRLALGHVNESPQEAPRGVLVAVLAAPGVQEVAVPIDGAVERAPAPGDLHVGLVQVPGAAGAAAPLRAEPLSDARREAALPLPDRLGGDGEAPLEPHLGDVAAAERVAQPLSAGSGMDSGVSLSPQYAGHETGEAVSPELMTRYSWLVALVCSFATARRRG